MSEDATTPPPDGGGDAPLAGERLAEARRARQISIQEIANSLHLDEHKVRFLELNEFEKLGAPVFTKGYLKKYAALVGVPVDDVLADYYRVNRATGAPLVIPARIPQSRDMSLGPWFFAVVAVVLVAGAGWWLFSAGSEWWSTRTEPATVAPFADEQRDQATPLPDVPATSAGDEGDAGGQASSDNAAPQQASPVEPPPESDPPGSRAPSEVELRITFSGDCWTEVTDVSGERLYFGLGSAGRTVTVTGRPPLEVLLGNSAHASLAVNGSSYPVPVSARRGDTARLTITDI
jgi:cytoskeleton protein RodZ